MLSRLRRKVQKVTPCTAHSGYFDQYATTYYNQSYYYFGGGRHVLSETSGAVGYDQISRLDAVSWKWSAAGKLMSRRLGLGVIRAENRFFFVSIQCFDTKNTINYSLR